MDEQAGNIVVDVGRVPLFSGLEPTLVAGIATAAKRKKIAANDCVYWQGDAPHAFYYVLSGHVRRAIASSEGDEKLIDIISAGQHFGLAEVVSGVRHLSFVEAVEPALLLEIGRDGLMDAMQANRELAFRVLAALAQRQLLFEQEVAATYFHSGCRRLLDYLLREAENAGTNVIELPFSKSLIALRIGVTAATLSRALRDLSNAGLISVHGKTITLLEKLTARHVATEEAKQPAPHNRRRSDAWGDQAALSKPIGSRAWL